MRRIALTIGFGLAACCAAAQAQQGPTVQQATIALQNAMNREIQAISADPQSAQSGFDGPEASNMVRSLQVKSVDNCQASGSQSVTCDVQTSAAVKGNRHEDTHRYDFTLQNGQWEARLPAS